MPYAPPKPCLALGCGALTHFRWCDAHTANKRDADHIRGTAAERGYDREWRKVRSQALQRDQYLCVSCRRNERVTPAVDVDHIIPIAVAPELRLDPDNLQSLCRPCHRAKTERDKSLPQVAVGSQYFVSA